jgi:hypothetical protein
MGHHQDCISGVLPVLVATHVRIVSTHREVALLQQGLMSISICQLLCRGIPKPWSNTWPLYQAA